MNTESVQSKRIVGRTVITAVALLSAGGVCVALIGMSMGAGKPVAVPTGTQPATSPGANVNNRPLSPEEIDLAAASLQSFDVTTSATGELEARKQIDIRNQLEQPTTIVEIVKEGVQVKAGDVLVKLNSDSIQTQVDEDSLRVESSRAELVVAENNYTIQETQNASDLRKCQLDIDVAELELRKWQEGEVKSKQQANQLALEKATRELERLKEKYERSIELEKKGFLARDELKRDEVAYLEAKAAMKTAELNIVVYDQFEFIRDEKVKSSTVAQAKAELSKVIQKANSELAKADADRRNKREQMRLRVQKLDKLREQVEMATLRAPSDGLVVYATSLNRDRWGGGNSDGAMDIGRQVKRNEQLIVLPDTSEMVASVRVHESMTGRMRPGQQATIKVDALGGRSIPGTVDSIGVIAESGGWRDPNLREYTVKVRLDLTGVDVQLKPSMRAEAQILLDKVEQALTIPIQAVFSEGLVRYVLVPAKNGRFAKQPVRIGRRSDRFAEVLVGVSEGDRVLVREAQASEIIDSPWNKKALSAVGLMMLPDGRIMPAGVSGLGGTGRAGVGPPAAGAPKPAFPAVPAGPATPAVPAGQLGTGQIGSAPKGMPAQSIDGTGPVSAVPAATPVAPVKPTPGPSPVPAGGPTAATPTDRPTDRPMDRPTGPASGAGK